jgi:uncharacterized membrane protein
MLKIVLLTALFDFLNDHPIIDQIFGWVFLGIFAWYLYKFAKTHGKEKDNRNS